MSKLARSLVSKQKRRFKEDGFDLDLSYITESIIAMGIPSQGVEGAFRNPMSEVIRFFEHYHPEGAKIFNLCIEPDRQYAVENFSGQVASFPFYDHNCPPLTYIPRFCESAYRWLKDGLDHVVAVHCKAGKSRTGLMVCCLLMHIQEQTDPDSCIRFYGDRRTRDGKGVTIPSQRRYILYYKTMLLQNAALPEPLPTPACPTNRRVRLLTVELFNVPEKLADRMDAFRFAVMDHGTLDGGPNLFCSWAEGLGEPQVGNADATLAGLAGDEPASEAVTTNSSGRSLRWELGIEIGRKAVRDNGTEDIKLMFYEKEEKKDKRHKLFYSFFHTAFLPEPDPSTGTCQHVLFRDQLDKFSQKKRFPKAFCCVLTFSDIDPRPKEAPTPAESAFAAQKVHFDGWVAEETQKYAQLARQGKIKKGKTAGSEKDDVSCQAKAAKAEAFDGILQRYGSLANNRLLDLIKAACVNFVEMQILAGPLHPANAISAPADWGSYRLSNFHLSAVSMPPELLTAAPTSEATLLISVGGIMAECREFGWSYERTKMPKGKDLCTCEASTSFSVRFEFPIELPANEEDTDSTQREDEFDASAPKKTTEAAAKAQPFQISKPTISVIAERVELEILTGKHSFMNKRLSGHFSATIQDAMQTALQEKAENTRGGEELLARVLAAQRATAMAK